MDDNSTVNDSVDESTDGEVYKSYAVTNYRSYVVTVRGLIWPRNVNPLELHGLQERLKSDFKPTTILPRELKYILTTNDAHVSMFLSLIELAEGAQNSNPARFAGPVAQNLSAAEYLSRRRSVGSSRRAQFDPVGNYLFSGHYLTAIINMTACSSRLRQMEQSDGIVG